MSEYDFSGLTEKQQWLLTMQGWSFRDEAPQPQPRTVQKLIDRGLLVVAEPYIDRGLMIRQYVVPIHVHMAWCQYCSDNYKDEDQ